MSFCSRPLVAEPPKAYAIGGSRRVPYPYRWCGDRTERVSEGEVVEELATNYA